MLFSQSARVALQDPELFAVLHETSVGENRPQVVLSGCILSIFRLQEEKKRNLIFVKFILQ